MSIRPSAAADISRLIAELTDGDLRRRELAAARLAVIGTRATTALLSVAGNPDLAPAARVAALETLASIGDPRAAPVAQDLAGHETEAIALAGIDLLGQLARGTGRRATLAFDRLAALVTSPDTSTGRRLAALQALDGQPERLMKPLYEAVAREPASRVVARVTRRQAGALEPLEAMVGRGLPDDALLVAAIVRDDGDQTSLPALKKALDAVRGREDGADDTARPLWATVRGALHQQLAARGSRLALYDLRETLEAAAGPLPVGFLSAAAAVGDTACLRPLARAWVDTAPDDRWWREHLADAFRSIVRREGLSRRHPTLKKILEHWPSTGVLVAAARR